MIDLSSIPWYGKLILVGGFFLAFYVTYQRAQINLINKIVKKP